MKYDKTLLHINYVLNVLQSVNIKCISSLFKNLFIKLIVKGVYYSYHVFIQNLSIGFKMYCRLTLFP